MADHTQFNLPTSAERQAQQPVQSDFELKQANVLKTAKDLYIKEVLAVTNSETAHKKGQRFGRTTFSGANYTLSTSDYLLGLTSLAIAPSIGLPLPSLVGTGKTFIVKDEVGGAATTTITIRSEGEKTIDGATSATITTAYGSKSVYSDGSNWFTY
jgi:hypothetical protein